MVPGPPHPCRDILLLLGSARTLHTFNPPFWRSQQASISDFSTKARMNASISATTTIGWISSFVEPCAAVTPPFNDFYISFRWSRTYSPGLRLRCRMPLEPLPEWVPDQFQDLPHHVPKDFCF